MIHWINDIYDNNRLEVAKDKPGLYKFFPTLVEGEEQRVFEIDIEVFPSIVLLTIYYY